MRFDCTIVFYFIWITIEAQFKSFWIRERSGTWRQRSRLAGRLSSPGGKTARCFCRLDRPLIWAKWHLRTQVWRQLSRSHLDSDTETEKETIIINHPKGCRLKRFIEELASRSFGPFLLSTWWVGLIPIIYWYWAVLLKKSTQNW